jgi:hypothetical protein
MGACERDGDSDTQAVDLRLAVEVLLRAQNNIGPEIPEKSEKKDGSNICTRLLLSWQSTRVRATSLAPAMQLDLHPIARSCPPPTRGPFK